MPSPVNPYESPRPDPGLPPVVEAEYMQVARRPKTPLVVAIISLVLGVLSLLGNVSSLAMYVFMPEMAALQGAIAKQSGQSTSFMISMLVVGTLMAIWLCAVSFGLSSYRDWGRIGFNFYAVLAILMALVGAFMAGIQDYASAPGEINTMENELRMIRRATAVGLNLLGMLFPALGMYFLNRPTILRSLK